MGSNAGIVQLSIARADVDAVEIVGLFLIHRVPWITRWETLLAIKIGIESGLELSFDAHIRVDRQPSSAQLCGPSGHVLRMRQPNRR